MQIKEHAILIGRCETFFYTMKKLNKPLYDKLLKIGAGSLSDGWFKLQNIDNNLNQRAYDMNILFDNKLLNIDAFGEFLSAKNIYSNRYSFRYVRKEIFKHNKDRFVEKTIYQKEKILNAFDEYIEINNIDISKLKYW
jgi:hypothetical protein